MYELRRKELEIFSPKEITGQIEITLEAFCTSERVDNEVRRIWMTENSTRKQIQEKDIYLFKIESEIKNLWTC